MCPCGKFLHLTFLQDNEDRLVSTAIERYRGKLVAVRMCPQGKGSPCHTVLGGDDSTV